MGFWKARLLRGAMEFLGLSAMRLSLAGISQLILASRSRKRLRSESEIDEGWNGGTRDGVIDHWDIVN